MVVDKLLRVTSHTSLFKSIDVTYFDSTRMVIDQHLHALYICVMCRFRYLDLINFMFKKMVADQYRSRAF